MTEQLYQDSNYCIQEKSSFQVKDLTNFKCQTSHIDQCYRNYLEKKFQIGFGQLYDVFHEKEEFSKPALVILSPTLEINELEILTLTDKLITLLKNMKQYRKRYAIIHSDENSYIIGGYVFDAVNKLRKLPENDYKYNHSIDRLQSIARLPDMVVSFGFATGKILEVGIFIKIKNSLLFFLWL